jgi:hypothetical protein
MGGGVSRERTASAASWDFVLWELKKRAAEAKDKASLGTVDMRVIDKPLPKRWVLVHSKVYRTHFYYNRETKTSSWTRPEEVEDVVPVALFVEAGEEFNAGAYSGEKHSLKRSVGTKLCFFHKKTAARKSKGILPAVLAMVLRDAATEHEPCMTALLKCIAREFEGKLEGLEFKLKSPESLKEKVSRDVREANLKLLEDIEQRRVNDQSAYRDTQSHSRARMNSKVCRGDFVRQNAISPMRSIHTDSLDEASETNALSDNDEPISPFSMSVSPLSARAAAHGDPLGEQPRDRPTRQGHAPSFESFNGSLPFSQDQHLEAEYKMEDEMGGDLQIAATDHEAEEIALELSAEKDFAVDMETIVWAISDVLRYTIIFETSHYTDGVRATRSKLQDKNITPAKQKNYWGPGDAYQGINDVFSVPCDKSPTGRLLVEVQFHTPESFAHKMKAHVDYETFRQTMDPELKTALWRESCAAADRLPVPPSVMELPALCAQPAPITTNLYVELVLERAMKIQNGAACLLIEAADQAELVLANIKEAPAKKRLGGEHGLVRIRAMKKTTSSFDQWMNLIEVAAETMGAIEPITMTPRLMSPSVVEKHIKHALQHLQRVRESSSNPVGEDGHDLKFASLAVKDALILSVVIAEEQYAATVALMLEQLSSKANTATGNKGFDLVKVENDWASSVVFTGNGVTGGFGVRCEATMAGEDDGVAFTPDDAYPFSIQFHTPQSFIGVLSLKSAWSQYRSSNTASQRKKAKKAARQIAARVNVPRRAKMILNFSDFEYSSEPHGR